MPAAHTPRPARVVVELDGDRHVLGVGDLIGRLPSAALVVDDPRVSEAHAIVSLRRAALHLLALRRLPLRAPPERVTPILFLMLVFEPWSIPQ